MNNKEQIDSILNKAKLLIPAELLPDLPIDQNIKTYGWYNFEHKIWELGEEVRRIFVVDKNLAREESLLSGILSIAVDKRAKRGRQSFILLLGKNQYSEYAPIIVTQIDDEHVSGQVISMLNKMKAFNFAKEVKPFCDSKVAWIKKEAVRYLKNATGSE